MENNFENSRFGKFTASEIHALLSKGRNKDAYFGDSAMTYIREKIAEIITGEPKQQVKSAATEWGLEKEIDAVKWFETVTGKKVQHFGAHEYKFFAYNTYSGCSPDGLVNGESANIQVKCPFVSANHIAYMIAEGDAQQWLKANEPKYYTQCQFEMMCCKTDKCYFVSYDDRAIEPQHRMKIIELLPDIELQSELSERIEKAAEIVRASVTRLQALQMPIVK